MRLAIVSDSHVPSRATKLPAAFQERIRDADHVLHAGDFDSADAFADFRDLAPDHTAVSGNLDPGTLDLPAVATYETEGVRFVVTHGTGAIDTYEERVAGVVAEHASDDLATVGVCGHTHEVMDAVHDGYRLLNPGSVTGADPADVATMYTAAVADGAVDVTLHEA